MKILLSLGLLMFGLLVFGVLAFFWVTPTTVEATRPGVETHTGAEAHVHCPPCGMDVSADAPKHELAGMTFAFCSERCQEVVAADPESFAQHAISMSETDEK